MLSLKEYIQLKYDNVSVDNLSQYSSGVDLTEVDHILNNVVVEQNSETKVIPQVLASQLQECYHIDGIYLIIEYLKNKGVHNVLNIGLLFDNSNRLPFKGINPAVELLKGRSFEVIKYAIGTVNFLDLILNTSTIWRPSNTVIWGSYKPYDSNNKPIPSLISPRPMLYRFGTPKQRDLFPNTAKGLLKVVLGADSFSLGSKVVKKRYRKVLMCFKNLLRNHQIHKYEYPYIVDQICKTDAKGKELINSTLFTKRSHIIDLIHTVIYKIVPTELFGTKENRTKIMRFVPKIINGTISLNIKVDVLLNYIKLTDVSWLKPRDSEKMTKHEFLKARKMFSSFLMWLFNDFICKLTQNFFYVTNGSQDQRLLFYKHHIWKKITKRYMSKYFAEHLRNQPDSFNSFESFERNRDYIGRLCLYPKKNTFRLIVKPFKGSREENIAYLTYQKRLVRPINKILNHIRENNDCVSVLDIVDSVYEYKSYMLKKYNETLPQIYAFKFDAKNAYDSLPHDLINRIISEKLDAFTSSDKIYVQLYQNYEHEGRLKGRDHMISDSLDKLNLYNQENKRSHKPLVDLHETFTFTKYDILKYVKTQFKNTCIHTKSRSYFRDVGVFQGFPLSGTLFNIVYDNLVTELYKIVNNNPDTKIIRLVDDFLILSSNYNDILHVKKLMARPLEKYNLTTNRQKTVVSLDKISFTGISINVPTLTCFKDLKEYNNAPILTSSLKKLYATLLSYGKIWIRHSNLFDPSYDKSGEDGALFNFLILIRSLVYKFTNSCKVCKLKRFFCLKEFNAFINKLLHIFSHKVNFQLIKFDPKRYKNTIAKILVSKGITKKKERIR